MLFLATFVFNENSNLFSKWQHFITCEGGNGQYNSPAFIGFIDKNLLNVLIYEITHL